MATTPTERMALIPFQKDDIEEFDIRKRQPDAKAGENVGSNNALPCVNVELCAQIDVHSARLNDPPAGRLDVLITLPNEHFDERDLQQ